MGFSVSILTDPTSGKLKALKDSIDSLSTAITYRTDEIEDIGVNNEYEIGNTILQEIEIMTKVITSWKWRLDSLRFGKGPTGTAPIGAFGP